MEQWLNAACYGFALAGTAWGATRVRSIPAAWRCRIWSAALVGLALLLALGAVRSRSGPAHGAAAGSVIGAAAPRTPAATEPLVRLGGLAAAPAWPFAVAWGLGVAWRLSVLGLAVGRIRRARRGIAPFPAEREAALSRWTAAARGRATLGLSGGDRSAAMLGFGHPIVTVPRPWLPRLTDEDLDALLLHELAHARRRDDLGELLTQLLVAVCWFHPAAWWMANRVRFEREVACDERAARVVTARGYARSLAKAGEVMRATALGLSQVLAPSATARPGPLARRIERVLALGRPRRQAAGRAACGAALLAMAVIVVEGRSLPPVFGVPVSPAAGGISALALIPTGPPVPAASAVPDDRGSAAVPTAASAKARAPRVRPLVVDGVALAAAPAAAAAREVAISTIEGPPAVPGGDVVDTRARGEGTPLRAQSFGQLSAATAADESRQPGPATVSARAGPVRSLGASLSGAAGRTGRWFSRAGVALAGAVTPG